MPQEIQASLIVPLTTQGRLFIGGPEAFLDEALTMTLAAFLTRVKQEYENSDVQIRLVATPWPPPPPVDPNGNDQVGIKKVETVPLEEDAIHLKMGRCWTMVNLDTGDVQVVGEGTEELEGRGVVATLDDKVNAKEIAQRLIESGIEDDVPFVITGGMHVNERDRVPKLKE